MQATATALGRKLLIVHATTESEIDEAFSTLINQRAKALLIEGDPFFNNRKEQIVALAASHALPTIYNFRDFVAVGGLMSYGCSITDSFRQVGIYAGRILKGEKPADLPVLQPTKFELVVNQKAAKLLGLTLSPDFLSIADEVIE
jgi:putative ABC transport system substrate-binding protein